MSNAVKHLYEFGPFQLDPGERLLLRASERLDLPPRVFDVLVVLVENQGRLLEKNELMDRVWPGTAIEENNLTQAVYQLRKILHDGEGENGARYIETVSKRGYRFLAAVRETDGAPAGDHAGSGAGQAGEKDLAGTDPLVRPAERSEAQTPNTVPASDQPRAVAQRSRAWRWIVGLAILLLVAAVAWRVAVSHSNSDRTPIRSIAVLPLQNLSNDQSQEYFADGMTDELITQLAHISELKVVSHTSVMQYKSTRKPLPQIGRELGVDAVVEGSVLRSGDRVRITAQLIHASNDRHLWAQSYEGELRDVLSLQAWVADAITHQVRLTLDVREQNQLHAARHYDPEAYDLYLRGRYAIQHRNLEAIHQAKGFYEQAAARDPNFPLAYTGLADCYTLLALFGDGYPAVPAAIANARHALALDDTLAQAHTSLAATYVLDWKWVDAEKEFRRALELNPNDAQTHQWYGNLYLGPVGRHAEAIAELKRAVELDPLSLAINNDLGYAYFLAGDDDLALAQYKKVLAMDSSFLPVHYDMMLYYHKRGMFAEQIDEFVQDETLIGHFTAAANIRRLANQKKKLYETVAKTGGALGEKSKNPTGSPVAIAQANAELGHKDLALAALQRSIASHEIDMIYLKVDPSWDSLRDTPQFKDLLRQVGLL
jgi:TolB-like protein/DNA-binding winged helix-turn-helix (wHTH) protein/tetratricopeptide (TPR) repeat protein